MPTEPAADARGRITVGALARVFELTPGRIQQFVEAGVIPRAGRGIYELIPCVQGYLRHLRKQLADQGMGSTDYVTERARLTRARADVAEMDRGISRGELIPGDQIEAAWLEFAGIVRQRILTVPDKLAARLAAVRDPVQIARIVRTELTEALGDISKDKSKPPSTTGADPKARARKDGTAADADG
jgi:phage terminase Nu1 subunit (DNA packaging protein)